MKALLIGNSDGIGLELTKLLLSKNYTCIGISRSHVDIDSDLYTHYMIDVSDKSYKEKLQNIISAHEDLKYCIFLVGIGNPLDWNHLEEQTEVMQVNLIAAVDTTEVFLQKGSGHFIGLSSTADLLTLPNSPSYSASKAALSKYWEALALANKNPNIKISNIRFGFVDTKMASSPIKPFMLTRAKAARIIYHTMQRPKARVTTPVGILFFISIYKFILWLRLRFQ